MIKTNLQIKIVDDPEDIKLCYALREKIFVMEQNIPLERVKDEKDGCFVHFLIFENNRPIGTARISFNKDENIAFIERLCILKEYRKIGAGKFFMEELIEYCKKRHFDKIFLSSQERVTDFYGKVGFEICSKIYMDSDLPHFKMQLLL